MGKAHGEHATAYRLDGLMARAMDQDLLPVLLGLRAMRSQLGDGLFFAWPGVEFHGTGEPDDVDLLASDGRTVFFIECKARAERLRGEQLERLIKLAAEFGVRPGLAAPEGLFPRWAKEMVVGGEGAVRSRISQGSRNEACG